jgi:hypothetical protein
MNFSAGTNGWVIGRHLRWLGLTVVLGLTAGCTANGPSPVASSGFGPTVAFESVDGPPPQVFDRLVGALQAEGASRNISVVSREARASYRVRSYYAAQIKRGNGSTSIAWVWDVYDVDQSRALRLSGTEPAGKAGRDAWDAADDKVLRRIAEAGLTGLTGLITGNAPGQTAPAPADQPNPAVAALSDGTEGATETHPNTALAFSAH